MLTRISLLLIIILIFSKMGYASPYHSEESELECSKKITNESPFLCDDFNQGAIIQRFSYQNNTIISSTKLDQLIDKCKKSDVNADFKHRIIKQRISEFYACLGYINSGVSRIIKNGNHLTINIVEGTLEKAKVDFSESNFSLNRKEEIESRLSKITNNSRVFNRYALLVELEKLKVDFNLKKLDAKVYPVKNRLGLARIELQLVKDNVNSDLNISVNNYIHRSIGGIRVGFGKEFQQVFNRDDHLYTKLFIAEGLLGTEVEYNIDFGKLNWAVNAKANKSKMTEGLISNLDIKSQNYALNSTVALKRKKSMNSATSSTLTEFDFSTGIAFSKSKSQLLDREFSFVPGDNERGTSITSISTSAEWRERRTTKKRAHKTGSSKRSALYAAVALEHGIGELSRINSNEVEEDFYIFKFDTHYKRTLQDFSIFKDPNLSIRGHAQLSTDVLPSSKNMGLGGVNSLRGVEINSLLIDKGATFSAEIEGLSGSFDPFQMPAKSIGDGNVFLKAFVDLGVGKDNDIGNDWKALGSIGLGATWKFSKELSIEVDWGKRFFLNNFTEDDKDRINESQWNFNIEWNIK